MNKKQLKRLGFTENKISKEESGSNKYSYFTLDIGDICLISSEFEEGKRLASVTLFDYNDVEFNSYKDLKSLIKLLNKNRKDVI